MNRHTTTITASRSGRRIGAVRLLVALAASVLFAAACTDDGDAGTDGSTVIAGPTVEDTDSSLAATTASTDPETTGSASTESTTTETTAQTTTGGSAATTLPGEPFDGFPQEGDLLSVMGVAHDDVLNVRDVPGAGQIVATAEPTAADVVATGEARLLPTSIWYEVTVDGTTGWASAEFLGFSGVVDDATAEFLDGDDPPLAETMVELGELVAEGFASEDPPSSIVQSVAPTVGDLGEITFDVIGLGDDAVAGYRLHIFATPDEGGEAFGLKTIERTTLCTRGLTGELCS